MIDEQKIIYRYNRLIFSKKFFQLKKLKKKLLTDSLFLRRFIYFDYFSNELNILHNFKSLNLPFVNILRRFKLVDASWVFNRTPLIDFYFSKPRIGLKLKLKGINYLGMGIKRFTIYSKTGDFKSLYTYGPFLSKNIKAFYLTNFKYSRLCLIEAYSKHACYLYIRRTKFAFKIFNKNLIESGFIPSIGYLDYLQSLKYIGRFIVSRMFIRPFFSEIPWRFLMRPRFRIRNKIYNMPYKFKYPFRATVRLLFFWFIFIYNEIFYFFFKSLFNVWFKFLFFFFPILTYSKSFINFSYLYRDTYLYFIPLNFSMKSRLLFYNVFDIRFIYNAGSFRWNFDSKYLYYFDHWSYDKHFFVHYLRYGWRFKQYLAELRRQRTAKLGDFHHNRRFSKSKRFYNKSKFKYKGNKN